MKNKLIIFTLLVLNSFYGQAEVTFKPLIVGDMNPLTSSYGAPRDTSPATLLRGQWQWQLTANISNTLHIEEKNRYQERLLIDAESSRHALRVAYGLGSDWNVRFTLPFMQHEAGSLDSFIDDFHQALGFPEGSRPNRKDDQFSIFYSRAGQDLVNISQPQSGLGDASLSFVRDLETDYENTLSIGVKLKFPTGKDVGSDTHDFALWATAGDYLGSRVNHFVSAGLIGVEKNKGALANLRKSSYGFLRYGLNWQVSNGVNLKLQVDAQSQRYNKIQVRILGRSTSMALGGSVELSPRWSLDMAVIEDIDVRTAPDVVFHFNLSKRYGA